MTTDAAVRPYQADDRDRLYEICLRTGDSGSDASALYDDPALLGHVFVGPYVALQPAFSLVVADAAGAGGYIVGTADSRLFARRCEEQWWPKLRHCYRNADLATGRQDDWLVRWIRNPPELPEFVEDFPSHLHIDLLPPWQGGGWGRELIERFCGMVQAAGSTGIHLGVASDNIAARGFYRHLGFTELTADTSTVWMGRLLT